MKPDLYQYFEHIWKVRNDHMLKDLPTFYVFALKVCYKDDCQHPVSKKSIRNCTVWFQDGPPIEFLPFLVPDLNWPWRPKDCEKCDGDYFKPPCEKYLQLATKYYSQSRIQPENKVKQRERPTRYLFVFVRRNKKPSKKKTFFLFQRLKCG